MIYLDNAATTAVDARVLRAMSPYFSENYGNPGGLYSFGRKAASAVDRARKLAAGFIGADPDSIIFTSGGTESNNTVFRGLEYILRAADRRTVLISAGEHDSVFRAAGALGPGFTVLPVKLRENGEIDMDDLREKLTFSVGLVSCMYVNNETGAVNDVEEIAKLCHGMNALFHTDCVQAAAAMPIDVKEIGCDFLSLSSHKLHGPKGVGALYAKDRNLLTPLIRGGDDQEFGLRGGTENVPGIVGFGEACGYMEASFGHKLLCTEKKTFFYKELMKSLEAAGLQNSAHVNGRDPFQTGNILNLRFDGIDAETMVLAADAAGVCISAGSACRSRLQTPSRTLKAMGLSDEEAMQSVRFSFSNTRNTYQDAIDAAAIIANLVARLKKRG